MTQKITVNPTGATAAMTKVSAATHDVIDDAGRIITLKKPQFFAQFELVRALGADAQNSSYVAMTAPLLYVDRIDGQVTPLPSNAAQIKALIQRLDEHGYAAVTKGIEEHFGVDSESAVDKEALKN